jgi:hypothetical protein
MTDKGATTTVNASRGGVHVYRGGRGHILKASNLIEVLSAHHQAKYVNGEFEQRGGIMLVAAPGQLKSTLIRLSLEEYPDALLLSDLNVNTLTSLKSSLIDQRYVTLGFGEFEKLYQRNPATAKNIEAHVKALIEEGFQRASFEDQRAPLMPARCAVIGGITPSMFSRKFTQWDDEGFSRRFIFVKYTLANPDSIIDAITEWKAISFGRVSGQIPVPKKIPYNITKEENKFLHRAILRQPHHETPYVIVKKIFCVLKWRYNAQKAKTIFMDFAESLADKGAYLEI